MSKALTSIGLFFFYVHWCVVFLLTLICNVFKFIWKSVSQATPEKHHLSPFETTHDHVFAHICNKCLIQTSSFPRRVFPSRPSTFKLKIRPTLKCGGSTRKINCPRRLILSCSCMGF